MRRGQEAYPSTGLKILAALAHRFPPGSVAYMGFDFHEAEHGHYFEDKFKLDTCHHMTEEGRVLRDMEREGIVYR
eukprot:scaffold4126_cov383-Prasinococcus_capsulatus_cf.AAC.7